MSSMQVKALDVFRASFFGSAGSGAVYTGRGRGGRIIHTLNGAEPWEV